VNLRFRHGCMRGLIEEVRFALDSPLEGRGFEPSVPLRVTMVSRPPRSIAAALPETDSFARVDNGFESPSLRCSDPSQIPWKRFYVLNHSQHNFRQRTTQADLDEIEDWTDRGGVSCKLVSEMPNSLLAGKIQGILFVWASECDYRLAIQPQIQWLTAQFPTRRNREFISP
jgi:hypothetical protein